MSKHIPRSQLYSGPQQYDFWGNVVHGFTAKTNLSELVIHNSKLGKDIEVLETENKKLHEKIRKEEIELNDIKEEMHRYKKKEEADKAVALRAFLSTYEESIDEFNQKEEKYLNQQLHPTKKGMWVGSKSHNGHNEEPITKPRFPNGNKFLEKMEANLPLYYREGASAPVTNNTTTVHHHGGTPPGGVHISTDALEKGGKIAMGLVGIFNPPTIKK